MNELEKSLSFIASESELSTLRESNPIDLPVISVVIPSFNQAGFIEETIGSVLDQKYPRLEIFVADGGSTDGTKEILERYAEQHPESFRFVCEADGGHHNGVNKGIIETTGEIIAWVNSDDIYLPNTFWKIATFFFFNRGAMVVYGRNKYVDRNLDFVVDYPVDWSPLLGEQKRRMMHFCLQPQPSVFFKRSAIQLCGGLCSKTLDYELWLRWQENLPFFFYDDFLSLSRLHDDAITTNADTDLLEGICKTVHQYYLVVPRGWAYKYAQVKKYGRSWSSDGSEQIPPPGAYGIYCWLWLNLKWSPIAIRTISSRFLVSIKQAWRLSA